MKILHTADLHLGAPMRALLPPREQRLRREELLSAFTRLLETAKKEGCAAVIIAGDLFDTEAAAMALAPAVTDAIRAYAPIDFYYVCGNHEGGFSLTEGLPSNLHVFRDTFTYFEKENVVFFGKSDLKYTDFDNISLQERKMNLLIAHGAWAEGYNKSADIPLGFLAEKKIDYCALGHYHTYSTKRIDRRGIAVYAGCPEGRGFDETGPKGAVLIDAENGHITHRFLPLSRRILHCIEADISMAKSLLDVFMICDKATESISSDDLVKLVLTGKRAHLPSIDPEAIVRHFLGRFYYMEAEDGTTAAPDIEKYRKENSLRGEFVRAVESDTALSADERLRILSLGLAALSRELGGDRG